MLSTWALSEPNCSESLDEFFLSMSQVRQWCDIGSTPPRQLRTALRRLPDPRTHWGLLQATPDCLVSAVAGDRRRELSKRPQVPTPKDDGRLLIYFPRADTCDGSAEQVSSGFFDSCSTPPWDTWVGYFIEEHKDFGYHGWAYLVAWIPHSFVDIAAKAMTVIAEGSLVWLEDSGTQLSETIQALRAPA